MQRLWIRLTSLYDEKGLFMQVTPSGHQLAHKVPDALGAAYNCTKFIEQRKTMMQQWADYLDELKAGAKVIPLHGKSA